jgi:two-component system, LytTR family, sensor kinase
VGLANVRDRLAARFGDEANLSAAPIESGGYLVIVTLPLIRHA